MTEFSMGLSKSDVDYLREHTTADLCDGVENTLASESQTDDLYLTPLTSGNLSQSTFIPVLQNAEQNHYVQSPESVKCTCH